jgi:CHASE2 domain-containing sensor protein
MEPQEVQEFANQMKESGESGGESLKSISLAISILAVLVAMVTVIGHRTHTEAVLMEARASDQWNEYQAKKIRMDNLAVTVDLLTIQPTTDQAAVSIKINEYKAHIEKWKSDLAEEQDKAHEFEREVARAEAKASRYDLGEALLQIAVVLSSITLFTRNRTYFFLGITLGAFGLLVAASALLVH